MAVTAIVGANWGDEGKGKMTDCLAADADVVEYVQHLRSVAGCRHASRPPARRADARSDLSVSRTTDQYAVE